MQALNTKISYSKDEVGTLPKFSVITVSYNQGEFIRQTIESVLAQNYPNFEHIVIDAGSTDNTIEILKSYPHLEWTSEPDRGQSHGLNKGFARATGDVIAWINSDDWYEPGAFHEVAKHIGTSPIVIGKCTVTDRAGNPGEEIGNVERNWYDTIKYWVYHSIPTQPGIFFRRSLFEELNINPSNALDENLHYTMDFDLWMRFQEKYPFRCHVDKLFAYARIYETNKTGANMAAAYREMSRVFRRHESRRVKPEQLFSFCYIVESSDLDFEKLAANAAQQSVKQVEVIFLDCGTSSSASKDIKRKVESLSAQYQSVSVRYLKGESSKDSISVRYNQVVEGACSQLVMITDLSQRSSASLLKSADLKKDWVAVCLSRFATNNLGLLLCDLTDQVSKTLFHQSDQGKYFNPVGAFSLQTAPSSLVLRKIAFLDLIENEAEEKSPFSPLYFFKKLLLNLTHKAWQISLQSDHADSATDREEEGWQVNSVFRLYENCALVDGLSSSLLNDAFTVQRAKNGFAIVLPSELATAAKVQLEQIPPRWRGSESDLEQLQALVASHPDFGPARFVFAKQLELLGDLGASQRELAEWKRINAKERCSLLYGNDLSQSDQEARQR